MPNLSGLPRLNTKIKDILLAYLKVESFTNTKGEEDVDAFFNKTVGEMTYFKDHPEYFGQYDTKDPRYELLNGEIYLLASPKVKHQMTVGKLHGELCKEDLGGCVPFISPFDIKLTVDDKVNVLQPDLGIICNLEKYTDDEDKYQGIPTLVVEVLSPSSISRDKVKKLNTYMLSGVEEYWIVDPIKERAYVYRFKDFEVEAYEEFDKADGIKSFRFEGMHVGW